MRFEFWPSAWAPVGYIACFILAVITYAISHDEGKVGRSTALRRGLTTFVIAAIIGNAINFGISHAINDMNGPKYAAATDVAAHFGLEPGKEYPLTIGGKGMVASGDASASSGFFSARADASFYTATTVTVSFTKDERSWQIGIPTNKVTWYVDSKYRSPTMTLNLSNSSIPGTRFDPQWSSCHYMFVNLAFTCVRYMSWGPLQVDHDLENTGLAGLITSGTLASAKFYVTPELYKKILGS